MDLQVTVSRCLPAAGRSDRHQRFLTGKEMLTAMGMCVTGFSSRASQVDMKNIAMLSSNEQVRCAGNGMHLACVGLAMLSAVLLTEPV